MRREAIIVLGMHRSGTSALTRALSLLGADLPLTLMAPHADNPSGYWESRAIARFNNQLLASAGLHWDCDAPTASGWFDHGSALASFHAEARTLLRQEYADSGLIVLKDPRLCRLFPFWEHVLASEGFDCKPLLCLRNPSEVARSLARRFSDPSLSRAAIRARSRAMLLWLRHVLDAERFTRHLPRLAVDYHGLVCDWRRELAGLSALSSGLTLPAAQDPRGNRIDGFLGPESSNRAADGRDIDEAGWSGLPAAIKKGINAHPQPEGLRAFLDALTGDLDRLVRAYQPLRAGLDRLAPEDIWADRILQELAQLHPVTRAVNPVRRKKPSVLFVSRSSESRAHRYRVVHAMEALSARQWRTHWVTAAAPGLCDSVSDFDAVIVSRGPWGTEFQDLRRACNRSGVPLVCDVDDLTFERDALEDGHVEHFNLSPVARQALLLTEADDFRSALESCDAAFATTGPLARATAGHAPRSFVLPNCFGQAMLSAAMTCLDLPKPSSRDGLIRVGFASGTATHLRDFATIADVMADFLSANRSARLVVLGYLDMSKLPVLASHSTQIECRPAVPLDALPLELARFDINLAPLEAGNPFCEAKSEIRCTAAAALGIPTVASATEPLASAVIHGVSGFVARSAAQWREGIQQLADDPALRGQMGNAARIDMTARFAPEKTGALLEQFLDALMPPEREAPRR